MKRRSRRSLPSSAGTNATPMPMAPVAAPEVHATRPRTFNPCSNTPGFRRALSLMPRVRLLTRLALRPFTRLRYRQGFLLRTRPRQCCRLRLCVRLLPCLRFLQRARFRRGAFARRCLSDPFRCGAARRQFRPRALRLKPRFSLTSRFRLRLRTACRL